ncbi:MAG: PIN domain-containing protein [Nocardioides sp.]|uniref:type II toxin-antitoxin system VapC family toxin n=1 Tax=Nocardioides sp. TaxID=35761 RepID=UPI0039E727AE
MIHLDTHVVIWIQNGEHVKLSAGVRELIETEDIAISPMVLFELGILFEIGRLRDKPELVLADLRASTGLAVDQTGYEQVARAALTSKFAFTRDPFDRMIAAHADAARVSLVTKDRRLREHLDFAVWP